MNAMDKIANLNKKVKIVLVIVITIALALGFYTLMYNIPGDEESLTNAAKEYMELEEFQVLDFLKEKNTAFVLYKTDEIYQTEIEDTVGRGGVVQFRRGYNGLWAPVTGGLSTNNGRLDVRTFSDYAYIGAEDKSIVYVFDLPERAASFKLEYYDYDRYEETGVWELSTQTGPVEQGNILAVVPAEIGWNNLHAERIYDVAGVEIPEDEIVDRVNGSSSARGSAESNFAETISALILLVGAWLVNRIRKEEE